MKIYQAYSVVAYPKKFSIFWNFSIYVKLFSVQGSFACSWNFSVFMKFVSADASLLFSWKTSIFAKWYGIF